MLEIASFCNKCGSSMALHDKRYSICVIKSIYRHDEKNCNCCNPDELMRRKTHGL